MSAEGSDHPVDLLVIGAVKKRIPAQKTYFVQKTYNFSVRGHNRSRARILRIENQAAVGTGQLAQREDIPMLLEEPPHFRLLPAPAGAEYFQGKGRALAAKLDGRSHM